MSCLITGSSNSYTEDAYHILKSEHIKLLFYEDLIKKINRKTLQRNKIMFILNDDDNNKEKIRIFNSIIKEKDFHVQIYYFDITKKINEDTLFEINEILSTNFELDELGAFRKFRFPIDKSDKHRVVQVFPKLNKRVIITGVCRDIEHYFTQSVNKFLYLTHFFTSASIIIFENDSKDNTVQLLKDFKCKNIQKNITLLSEKNVKGSRTKRIAHARNQILKYMEHEKLNPDFVITIDMDEILTEFECSSILYPFQEKINWSMFGGNSRIYYDMWALRTMDFPYLDFWKMEEISREERMKYYFKIPLDSKPIKVFSCFNGIGIYKYKHLLGCRYDGDTTCEHISLHTQMEKKYKAQLFIHPKLIVGPHKILSKQMDDEIDNVSKIVKNGFFLEN